MSYLGLEKLLIWADIVEALLTVQSLKHTEELYNVDVLAEVHHELHEDSDVLLICIDVLNALELIKLVSSGAFHFLVAHIMISIVDVSRLTDKFLLFVIVVVDNVVLHDLARVQD